jgi:hypothetical protein
VVALDLHEQNKIFSKTTQSDANLIFDYLDARQNYLDGLKKLKSMLGTHATEAVSDSKTKKYQGIALTGAPTGSLGSRETKVKSALLAVNGEQIDYMLERLDKRLPRCGVAEKLGELLDYRKMPVLEDGEAVSTLLESWGGDAADWLVDNFFPFGSTKLS